MAPITMAPTSSSATPTETPTGEPVNLMDIASTVSDATEIASVGTPANRAFDWLENIDSYLEQDPLQILQRFILAVFYFSSNGPAWNICTSDSAQMDCLDAAGERFLSATPVCDWFGVTCDANNQILTIVIFGNNLGGGPVPAELRFLSSLEFLVLEEGTFTGIPDALGDLTRLKSLSLQSNTMTGSIPASLGNLPDLQVLNLAGNSLIGPIPSELGQSDQLAQVFLNFNQLTGSMPAEVCSLRAMGQLTVLMADCGGATPLVACDQPECCTLCF